MPEWLKALLLSAIVIGAVAVLAWLSVLLWPAAAAGPSERWGHDEETSAWFRGLRSGTGTPCCDYADGNRIDDPDYTENDDGSYEVNVPSRGGWHHVDKMRIVKGTNRVGYAIVWWSPASPEPYCFLPGSRG